MGLIQTLSELRDKGKVLHTPYGDFQLARGDKKQVSKMLIELQRATDALTRKDLRDWRNAWQRAISVDAPDRRVLYDIYQDCLVDLHLCGCISQRKGFVTSSRFRIVDNKGNINEEALHYFEQEWFDKLIDYCLDSIYWGHSLIELGDITTDGDGCVCYNGVNLIPRKHVIPEKGRVVRDLGADWTSGINYKEAPYNDYLIEAGKSDDLGLLLKAASQTIPKKNMLAFWDAYGEIFGMPMRIARTTSRDPKEHNKLLEMLRKAGSSQTMVANNDTEIQFVESAKGDAFNVYDRRTDRANSEISKLIIGQTMTVEDGSSLAQSKTHLEVMMNLIKGDKTMIRNIVNNQLIPRMVKHGYPLQGLHFEWDDTINYSPEQQLAYETMIADRYEVDPKYFEDKYNMPVGERRNNSPLLPTPEKKEKSQKNSRPFFD